LKASSLNVIHPIHQGHIMFSNEEFRNKKVLILGLGREGISTYSFLRSRFPYKKLILADQKGLDSLDQFFVQRIQKDGNVEIVTGQGYLRNLREVDVIFKTPGIPHNLPEYKAIANRGYGIYSNTGLFFDLFKGTIIGVTGTKGKSTTTRMIFDVLSAGGVKVKLTGNIGIPPLSVINETSEDTIVVTELSSHQLMNIHRSPHISVLQGIFPEHLDYYADFNEYVDAKSNITRFQLEKDYLLFCKDNRVTTNIANKSVATKLSFGLDNTQGLNCYFDSGWLKCRLDKVEEKIINSEELKLIGRFNLVNIMPAILIGRLLGIPSKRIQDAVRNFIPLEHRLEYVAESHAGIKFYNDSLATTPESTINAIEGFPEKPIILIAGGFERKQDFRLLAMKIIERQLRGLILFPTTGIRILEEVMKITNQNLPITLNVSTMQEAVQHALRIAQPGDVVLLSPASASYNQFLDYRDRGNQFKHLVMKEIQEQDDKSQRHFV